MAKKKKKKSLTLLILLGVLVVACVGYFALLQYNEAQEAAEAEDDDTEEESETLLAFEGTVNSLSYVYGTETISVVYDADEDTWEREDNADFALTQSTIETMVDTLTDAVIERDLGEDIEDLSEYGLEDPSWTVTIGDDAGASYTVLIGNVNNTAGGVYAMIDGESRVVMTDSDLAEAFGYTWLDLAEVDDSPNISSSKITSISIEQNGETVTLEAFTDGLYTSDYTESATLFLANEDGTYEMVDSSLESSILSYASGFEYTSMAAYEPDEETLAAMGFDDPTAVITVNYTEDVTITIESDDEDEEDETETVTYDRTYVLTVGSYDETTETYQVMYEGGSSVFTMDADTIDTLLAIDAYSIANTSPNDIEESTIDSIVISAGGSSVTISMEYTEVEVESDEDDTDTEDTDEEDTDSDDEEETTTETVTTYYLDGEEIDEDEFADLWDVIEIEAERTLTADESVTGSAEVTVTYYRNSEDFPVVTISYIPYSSDYYQVSVNGGTCKIAVNVRDVQALAALVEE